MRALMMDMPLTITMVMRHAEMYHGGREIVSATSEQAVQRSSYSDVFLRARKLFNALQMLGCRQGDRIATLAWNHQQHLELYYGVICGGYVLHTINPRLFDDQVAYIINHAQDKWLFTDEDFIPILERIKPQLKHVNGIVVLGAHDDAGNLPGNVYSYEDLLADNNDDCAWPELDENAACAMCYTSGTTGNPKGALYSHRSLMLHTLSISVLDADGAGANDIIMPLVPMFHVNAWGLPFRAPMVGAGMVFPGRFMGNPQVVSRLITQEKVTYGVSVPTIWQMLLDYLDQSGEGNLDTLRKAIVGGAATPLSLFRRFRDDYGVDLVQGWGMTELCSAGTLNVPGPEFDSLDEEQQRQYPLKQGRPIFGLEVRITDDQNNTLPWDGTTTGHLKVKGPIVARKYYGETDDNNATDADGWFTTGDVAAIDPDGAIRITDRSKDLIKSGGEWISSIDLENCAMLHPAVAEAAVIGATHPKWNERPVLIAVKKSGLSLSTEELLAWFDGKVASWWKPDAVVFVAQLPHTATGKVSKLRLREQYRDYLTTRDTSGLHRKFDTNQ